jgi:hypothetical protein
MYLNTAWVRARFCKLQKGCTRLAVASDKVYQLLAHGWWFSPGIPASSTTNTGRHDIAETLLKVALKHKNQSLIYKIYDTMYLFTSIIGIFVLFLQVVTLTFILQTSLSIGFLLSPSGTCVPSFI